MRQSWFALTLLAAFTACSDGSTGPVEKPEPKPTVADSEYSVVTVDFAARHQTIEGFGTALVTWSDQMRNLYNTPGFASLYAETMGMNMLRVSLWPEVLPYRPEYAGPEGWRNISAAHILRNEPRFEAYVSFAKALKAVNPNVKIIGSVWSPPSWMKVNRSIVDPVLVPFQNNPQCSGASLMSAYSYQLTYCKAGGGRDTVVTANRVDAMYHPHMAKWMVEMARLFQQEGVPLHAMSPGNEVMFSQWFESNTFTAGDLAKVVGLLGQRLDEAGMGGVKIFGPETMTIANWWDGVNKAYVDSLAKVPAFDVYATHGYTDGITGDASQGSSAEFWNLIKKYGKPTWVTEGGTGGHTWPAPVQKSGVAVAIHNAFVHGFASAFVPWQVSDSEPSEHGLMHLNNPTKKTLAFRHFSSFITPGAQRVTATPGEGELLASAYVHPTTRAAAVVLVNTSKTTRHIAVSFSGGRIQKGTPFLTSAIDNLTKLDDVPLKDRTTAGTQPAIKVSLPAESIVTIQGVADGI